MAQTRSQVPGPNIPVVFNDAYFSGFLYESGNDQVTALGNAQGNAAPITVEVSRIVAGAALTGVNLPSTANISAGESLSVTIINTSTTSKYIYPAQSETNTTLNGFAGANGLLMQPNSIGICFCTASGAWWCDILTPVMAVYNTDATIISFTMPAADIVGGQSLVVLTLTGTITGPVNATLPSAAATIAATHAPAVGDSWMLRIRQSVASTFAWTIVAGTNFTLGTGTYTIASGGYRDFIVTVTGTNAMTLQDIGGGTVT